MGHREAGLLRSDRPGAAISPLSSRGGCPPRNTRSPQEIARGKGSAAGHRQSGSSRSACRARPCSLPPPNPTAVLSIAGCAQRGSRQRAQYRGFAGRIPAPSPSTRLPPSPRAVPPSGNQALSLARHRRASPPAAAQDAARRRSTPCGRLRSHSRRPHPQVLAAAHRVGERLRAAGLPPGTRKHSRGTDAAPSPASRATASISTIIPGRARQGKRDEGEHRTPARVAPFRFPPGDGRYRPRAPLSPPRGAAW